MFTRTLQGSRICLLMEISCNFFPLSKQHRGSPSKMVCIQHAGCAHGLCRPRGAVQLLLWVKDLSGSQNCTSGLLFLSSEISFLPNLSALARGLSISQGHG